MATSRASLDAQTAVNNPGVNPDVTEFALRTRRLTVTKGMTIQEIRILQNAARAVLDWIHPVHWELAVDGRMRRRD